MRTNLLGTTNRARWLLIACIAAALAWPSGNSPSSVAQDRSARKVPIPDRESANDPSLQAADLNPDTVKRPKGDTYVALSSELYNVFQGREPASLRELRALEEQQSRVAEVIDAVTVNVQQGAAQGSGVIITADGYVLTAAHVAGGANREAWVTLSNGTRLEARTLGMNRDKDAGLIKIVQNRSTPWPHATLGISRKFADWAVGWSQPAIPVAGRRDVGQSFALAAS